MTAAIVVPDRSPVLPGEYYQTNSCCQTAVVSFRLNREFGTPIPSCHIGARSITTGTGVNCKFSYWSYLSLSSSAYFVGFIIREMRDIGFENGAVLGGISRPFQARSSGALRTLVMEVPPICSTRRCPTAVVVCSVAVSPELARVQWSTHYNPAGNRLN